MIETMVARLDEKLKENPQDAEGWQRLVRSYVRCSARPTRRATRWRAASRHSATSSEAGRAIAGVCGVARV